MNRQEFRDLCRGGVILDGAYGTELSRRGFPGGCCPEMWSFEHPEVVRDIVRSYREAGTRLFYAPTFGGNRRKLAEYHLEGRLAEVNAGLCRIAREAAGEGAFVFGDMAPTGLFVEPYGELPFEEAVDIFREQARACLEGGCDGFVIETMMDLQEARAAFLGAREAAPDCPVMVTMTFDESGRSLTGADPLAALNAFQHLGADAFGCNCSTGPERMAALLKRLSPHAGIPLVAKPNAGIPRLDDVGRTVFPMGAEEFAAWAAPLHDSGVALVGGCCGTTPAHIAALAAAWRPLGAPLPPSGATAGMLSSPAKCHVISREGPFTVVGERINPTGKKALQAELREGRMELVCDFARQQQLAGAQILDVNMGLAGIDEGAMMAAAIGRLLRCTDLPLCIDSTDPATVERALRLYPGRALLNSISAEKERLEKVLPIAARYGAMPILLPVADGGIPETAEARIRVVETLLERVAAYGYSPQDVCIDALIMTVSANPEAAQVALDVIAWCRSKGLNCLCGLSNVSFGLPSRRLLNGTFLGMAMGCGLNAAIANPLFTEIMDAVAAGDALAARDPRQQRFIARYGQAADAKPAAPKPPSSTLTPAQRLFEAVVNGDDGAIQTQVDALLAEKKQTPLQIIQEVLVPAITEVGRRYEQKLYFLPQLIAGAEAMQAATRYLQTFMQEADDGREKVKVVFATVQGDIHDIGKNIVIVMMRNYGFDVLDLGKDVPPQVILDAAVRTGASIVCLSALMTTTVASMRKTIELAREQGLGHLRFIIGGAVVDQHLADELGVSYGRDPMSTIRIGRRLAGLPEE